ncbi:peptidoglycan-binding domain-containing protein [Psychromonas sp. KJ10-10]|uniref:peptidoglycan-binding domain-containing protein n=1 Tax=Psychromonas sp. KJ10-10 TaxID=3391823 RepID=UPI0039B376E1
MQTIEILYSVGKGGKNKAIDVALIQALLKATFLDLRRQFRLGNNDVDDDYSLLEVNGSISDVLIVAIKQFQQDIVEMKIPDGRVDPNGLTFKKLIEIQKTPPVSLMKTIFKPADFEKTVLNTISTKRFKDFFKQYHGLTISKGEDLAGFFNKIKMDSKIICFEWVRLYVGYRLS